MSLTRASVSDDLTVTEVFTVRDGLVSISDDFYVGDNMLFADVSADNIYSSASFFAEGFDIDGVASISGNSTFYNNLTILGTPVGDGIYTSDSLDFDEFLDSMTLDADLYIGSTNDIYTSGSFQASENLYIVGTASISGQCVTGDSLLPIVDDVGRATSHIEYAQIKDVKPGMKVLSLNEKTAQIEPHRIKGLLDMGIKPIYELETEDGKVIRTTGNHPYLVKIKETSQNEKDSLVTVDRLINSIHHPDFTFIIANSQTLSSLFPVDKQKQPRWGLLDDFRTMNWIETVQYPETILTQIKELLQPNLVNIS